MESNGVNGTGQKPSQSTLGGLGHFAPFRLSQHEPIQSNLIEFRWKFAFLKKKMFKAGPEVRPKAATETNGRTVAM
jgi:hypothetical protein